MHEFLHWFRFDRWIASCGTHSSCTVQRNQLVDKNQSSMRDVLVSEALVECLASCWYVVFRSLTADERSRWSVTASPFPMLKLAHVARQWQRQLEWQEQQAHWIMYVGGGKIAQHTNVVAYYIVKHMLFTTVTIDAWQQFWLKPSTATTRAWEQAADSQLAIRAKRWTSTPPWQADKSMVRNSIASYKEAPDARAVTVSLRMTAPWW